MTQEDILRQLKQDAAGRGDCVAEALAFIICRLGALEASLSEARATLADMRQERTAHDPM